MRNNLSVSMIERFSSCESISKKATRRWLLLFEYVKFILIPSQQELIGLEQAARVRINVKAGVIYSRYILISRSWYFFFLCSMINDWCTSRAPYMGVGSIVRNVLQQVERLEAIVRYRELQRCRMLVRWKKKKKKKKITVQIRM